VDSIQAPAFSDLTSTDVARLLIDRGANPACVDNFGYSVIAAAAAAGHMGILM